MKNIYMYKGFNFTKYMHNEANFLKTQICFQQNRMATSAIEPTQGTPLPSSSSGEVGGRGSHSLPYHVHDREDVRGDVGLAVLVHHFLVCYHECLHAQALL